jgi:Na+-transporting NADH:ubiquinone oxidoreductase subunit C
MSQSDSLKNIVGVALGVCFVCSIFVATAAVYLKPRQDANRRLEQRRNVLIAGDLMQEKADVEKIFSDKIRPVLVELKTGEQLPEDKMTGELAVDKFDVKRLSKNPKFNQVIPADRDKAGLKQIPTHMMLYLVKEGDKTLQIIFPVWGNGLWSVMYGFIALDRDLKTVKGFTFYEHGETPGLGGEVDNPRWKASWKGKIAFDETGALKLKVLKGLAPDGAASEIDGLSGSTLTTRGVDDMIAFWFGETGYYRPFLDKLRQEGTHE